MPRVFDLPGVSSAIRAPVRVVIVVPGREELVKNEQEIDHKLSSCYVSWLLVAVKQFDELGEWCGACASESKASDS